MAVTLLAAAACAFVPPAHFGAALRGASRASHTPKMMIEATQGLSSDMYMDDRLTARMGFIDPMYNDAYYDGNRNAAMGEGMYGGSAYPRYGSRFARRDMYAQDAYSRRMADDFTDDYRYGGRGFDQLMRSRYRYGDMDRRERVGGYLRNRHYRYGRDGDWDRDGYYNDWDRGRMRYGSYGYGDRFGDRYGRGNFRYGDRYDRFGPSGRYMYDEYDRRDRVLGYGRRGGYGGYGRYRDYDYDYDY